jgi:ribosomal protein S18 acetylase RimI-like enzyme
MNRVALTQDESRTLRAGTDADAPAIGQLPLTAAAFRAIDVALRGASGILQLVIRDSAIIGVGSGGRQLDENLASRGYDGEIAFIYVLPQCRQQGVGADLLVCIARQLAASGMSEATSWAPRDNPSARRFYTHHGGQVVAERHQPVGNKLIREIAYAWTTLSTVGPGSRVPHVNRSPHKLDHHVRQNAASDRFICHWSSRARPESN